MIRPGRTARSPYALPGAVMGVAVLLVAAPSFVVSNPLQTAGPEPTVLQIELADIVHPISADFLAEGLVYAEEIGARAVVVRLDTPGGLVDSMRNMVESILASPVPVAVWVGPSGVRAASAGFFVLLSGDLALMASGTNTGAAHPVSSVGEIDEVMEQKIVNDVSAFLRSYVSRRDRNPEQAQLAITESESFTAEEALEAGFIDGIVGSVPDLLVEFDSREVRRFDGSIETLDLAGASVEVYEMNARQRALSTIMNPNVALVLGLLGLVGLYLEFSNPGLIVPGVVGGISLLLALFAFNLLPVNLAGASLIILAIALFVVEAVVPSSGILAIGGVVSMIAGGLMLVEGPIPQLRIQLVTILAIAIPLAVITILLVRLVFVSHRSKTVTGGAGMIGEIGTAVTEVFDKGKVLVHGEYWGAHASRPIEKGARVRVVKVSGLNVEVEPVTEEPS